MARDRGSRPEAKPLRLFVAFEVPDDAQDAIDAAIAPFRERYPAARWVPRANRHVTMKFLGRTWPRLRGWVEAQLAVTASRTPPIPTRLTSIGAFPGGRRARVLWAGVDDADGHLAALASALDDALADEFRPESRAFTAHCTVARSDPPLHLDEADPDVSVLPVAFTIERIVLFRSHLQRPAPRYEALATFPLSVAAVEG